MFQMSVELDNIETTPLQFVLNVRRISSVACPVQLLVHLVTLDQFQTSPEQSVVSFLDFQCRKTSLVKLAHPVMIGMLINVSLPCHCLINQDAGSSDFRT